MIKNAKAKGSRREREVRDKYLSYQHDVVKAAGSLGMFDLVCIFKNEFSLDVRTVNNVVLIQVKSNYISPLEVQVIADHVTSARKEIWIKKDHKPWVMAVIEEPIEIPGECGCVLPRKAVEFRWNRATIFPAKFASVPGKTS